MMSRFRTFFDDREGSVIVLFAGAVMMIALLTSGAIELHRRGLAEVKLQGAVDSAALAARAQFDSFISKGRSQSEARAAANAYGTALFNQAVSSNSVLAPSAPTVNFTWDSNDNLDVTSSVLGKTVFTDLVPARFMSITRTARAETSTKTALEFVLMLDNSGSMTFKDSRTTSRMSLLRDASRQFVNDIFDFGQKSNQMEAVRVAVVPWSITVNVKTEAPSVKNYNGKKPITPLPDNGTGKPTKNPISHNSEVTVDKSKFPKSSGSKSWGGCLDGVTSESKSNYTDQRVQNWKAAGVLPSLDPDPNIGCPTPMLGLSGNREQVIDTLERMKPVYGGTHADVGLRWGLRALSPSNGWPAFFGATTSPGAWNSTTKKVAVLITDGKNEAASPYTGFWDCSYIPSIYCNGSPGTSELDTMMLGWCNAMRVNYGIEVYTIALNIADPTALANLTSCVGPNKNRAYRIDAANLNEALRNIAQETMRLSLVN